MCVCVCLCVCMCCFFPPSVWRLYDFPSVSPLLSSPSLLLPSSSASAPGARPPYGLGSTDAAQLTVPIYSRRRQADVLWPRCLPGGSPVLWLSTNAVQPTAPIGDVGKLMSGGSGGSGGSGAPPALWLSTHAMQLTVPIGDDGKLVSGGSGGPGSRPVLWCTTNALQLNVPLGDDGKLMSGAPVPPRWPACPLV